MRIGYLIFAVVVTAMFLQYAYGEDPFTFNKQESKEVSKLSNMLYGSMASYFGQSDPPAPELINEFKLDPIQKIALQGEVKQLKKKLKKIVKRKAKRVQKQRAKSHKSFRALNSSSNNSSHKDSNDSEGTETRCISACAWASAWARASCTAKACAQCPGGIIRACGYARASAVAYGFGSACVSRCKEVKKPKC